MAADQVVPPSRSRGAGPGSRFTGAPQRLGGQGAAVEGLLADIGRAKAIGCAVSNGQETPSTATLSPSGNGE